MPSKDLVDATSKKKKETWLISKMQLLCFLLFSFLPTILDHFVHIFFLSGRNISIQHGTNLIQQLAAVGI